MANSTAIVKMFCQTFATNLTNTCHILWQASGNPVMQSEGCAT